MPSSCHSTPPEPSDPVRHVRAASGYLSFAAIALTPLSPPNPNPNPDWRSNEPTSHLSSGQLSRPRIRQKHNPDSTTASAAKIAVSYHWKVQ